jgi:hypothetical protein
MAESMRVGILNAARTEDGLEGPDHSVDVALTRSKPSPKIIFAIQSRALRQRQTLQCLRHLRVERHPL